MATLAGGPGGPTVVGGFSIADPSDGGMLDVVGLDGAVPALISEFARGL